MPHRYAPPTNQAIRTQILVRFAYITGASQSLSTQAPQLMNSQSVECMSVEQLLIIRWSSIARIPQKCGKSLELAGVQGLLVFRKRRTQLPLLTVLTPILTLATF